MEPGKIYTQLIRDTEKYKGKTMVGISMLAIKNGEIICKYFKPDGGKKSIKIL